MYNEDGTSKSTVDKFFDEDARDEWAKKAGCEKGDLLLIMAGGTDKTRKALGTLRLHLAEELGLRNPEVFAPLWVLDFPLLEWDEGTERYHAMHHPFTSPKPEDIAKMILFLSSDEASYITGQTFYIDGGISLN